MNGFVFKLCSIYECKGTPVAHACPKPAIEVTPLSPSHAQFSDGFIQ